jgi:hypothetical protein
MAMGGMASIAQRLVDDFYVILVRRQYCDGDSLSLVQLTFLRSGHAPVTPRSHEEWEMVPEWPAA